jgi:hypothetical protein
VQAIGILAPGLLGRSGLPLVALHSQAQYHDRGLYCSSMLASPLVDVAQPEWLSSFPYSGFVYCLVQFPPSRGEVWACSNAGAGVALS